MKKILSRRPVDLSGININEINYWLKSNNQAKDIIKCHAIISLHNGNSMQSVCNVLGITRETIRVWKEKLRQGGVSELLNKKKVGKRSKINIEKQKELKAIIRQKPVKHGYNEKKWTGKILKDFMMKKWNIKIGIRAAQLWIRQMK